MSILRVTRTDDIEAGEIGFPTMYTWIQCFSNYDMAAKEQIGVDFTNISLKDFLKAAISRMDFNFVENTLGVLAKRDADGIKRTPSERSYQMEFYRCVYACLPDGLYCHPDYGILILYLFYGFMLLTYRYFSRSKEFFRFLYQQQQKLGG